MFQSQLQTWDVRTQTKLLKLKALSFMSIIVWGENNLLREITEIDRRSNDPKSLNDPAHPNSLAAVKYPLLYFLGTNSLL
jgi:hypothetical protein